MINIYFTENSIDFIKNSTILPKNSRKSPKKTQGNSSKTQKSGGFGHFHPLENRTKKAWVTAFLYQPKCLLGFLIQVDWWYQCVQCMEYLLYIYASPNVSGNFPFRQTGGINVCSAIFSSFSMIRRKIAQLVEKWHTNDIFRDQHAQG